MAPRIVGGAVRVVEVPGQFSIDEFAGNVGSKDDTISIARVQTFADNVCEPWLTLHYDEWICVVKGKMVIEYGDKYDIKYVINYIDSLINHLVYCDDPALALAKRCWAAGAEWEQQPFQPI